MTRLERKIRNAQREQEIRAELAERRPQVVLVPQRLARVGLGIAIGVVACFALALAGCAARQPPHAALEAVEIQVAGPTAPNLVQFVVYRFDDEETGATCYILDDYSHGPSITCITGAADD